MDNKPSMQDRAVNAFPAVALLVLVAVGVVIALF